MSLTWPNKDADEVLDYKIDFADLLAGDTISTVTWVIAPSGLTKQSQSNTTTTATIWLTGGADGTSYTVTCTITTAGGRTFEQAVKIKIKAR